MNRKALKEDNSRYLSLATGGPLYNLYIRTGLAQPPLERWLRRDVLIVTIAWLPLFILCVIHGTAINGVKLPFIYDLETHTRFLISLPLLITAEFIVNDRINLIVQQFFERDIIRRENREAFSKIISFCVRLRNSIIAEISLIVIVLVVGHWMWREFSALDIETWYATVTGQLTAAGYWYSFVSLPIFQFILLRWYFRLFIWYSFLWQVAKLPLNLNSLHPDRAGGLGFLSYSVFAFSPVLLAHTFLLSGLIANRIWHAGVTITAFELEIIGILIYLIIIVFIPLTFFSVKLVNLKRIGTIDYGVTASTYVNEFWQKWVRMNAKRNERLLGTSDIQSLADLSNSYNVSSQMGFVPFSRVTVLQLIILIAAPLLPLLLTLMPLEAMISGVIKVLL